MGGCDQICNKKGFRYECSCLPEFKLDVDRKACKKRKLFWVTSFH